MDKLTLAEERVFQVDMLAVQDMEIRQKLHLKVNCTSGHYNLYCHTYMNHSMAV